MIYVRQYRQTDEAEWVRMRLALWPDAGDSRDALADAHGWAARMDAATFIALADDRPCGFVEVGERAYADGCDTQPVAYLEAWYVDPQHRRTGVGRLLVEAAATWARGRGYREFASDALLENTESHHAHEALGFAEVERAVRFRKGL